MARPAFAVAALVGAVALSIAAGHAALAANAAVAMQGAQFVPATVQVNVGEQVTWTNMDGIPHSARADNGSFDTGGFSSGSRTVVMPTAGSFGYFCAFHPTTMRGTVTVVGPATPAPTPPPAATRPPTPRPTPTVAVASPTPTPAATASPAPTASPSPSASVTETSSPSPVAQASPTATPGPSRSGDGDAGPLVAGAAAAGIGIALLAAWLIRRR